MLRVKIIEKITVKYFRSLHTIEVKNCSSVNVFSGRNDVGKSNVIKSLNLFFNGKVDWDENYEFYDNFSTKRLEEVRKESVKGKQFISIKIDFIRPNNYKGSLPPRFTVERKWYRDSRIYEESHNLSRLGEANKLPSSLVTAQRSLSTFLNKIHFEYVPAIKDRAYIRELLSRLQHSLLDMTVSQNADLLETATKLASHIEGQIGVLQNDFKEATNIQTAIMPPAQVSSLFQSFLVSTNAEDGDIPLKYRGDGLQSRYIASVLHYISVNSQKFYIWGYEEPELALEYSHAAQMADDFINKYAVNTQIFLTTHSPAFISLKGEKARCFRVTQLSGCSMVNDVNSSQNISDELKNELGIVAIQREVHDFYSKQIIEHNLRLELISSLEHEISLQKKLLVVTEGKTDAKILEHARKHYPCDAIIRSCDNTSDDRHSLGGAGALARLIESIHPEDKRPVIAIFDNDDEGQREFEKLSKNFKSGNTQLQIKKHINGYAWALLLPEPEYRSGFSNAGCLCIEFMFNDHVLNRKFNNGKRLEVEVMTPQLNIGSRRLNIGTDVIDYDFGCFKKIKTGKNKFADDVVSTLPAEDFISFKPIFDFIDEINLEFSMRNQ